MLKFYLSLIVGRIYLFFAKLFHKERSDKVAFLIDKICPDFLTYVKRPPLVVMVTGTNGKTTTTSLIANGLKISGRSVSYNDWGANLYSGHIRCFLETVNIFNKSIRDAIVLETDEVSIGKSLEKIKPNFIVVTNICRDSIRRNAYPEFIANTLKEEFKKLNNTTLILNADDPISSFIGSKLHKFYISVGNVGEKAKENRANDFTCCPKCNGKIIYEYRQYRHIGKFKCKDCDFRAIDADFNVSKVDYQNNKITIDKKEYKLVSNTIFNVYNEALAIGFFYAYGFDYSEISNIFDNLKVPESRENLIEVCGIKIHLQMAKGQNGSAASSVFESLVKDGKDKRLILILDEDYVSHVELDAEETITWLYDTDYEFLNNPCIKQIIIPSKLKYDYSLRLKMAGIDKKVFSCIDNYKEAYKKLNLKRKSDIYILYEVDDRPLALELADILVKEIEGVNK